MEAFIGFIQAYGSYVGFVVQILFYVVVAASAAWAAFTFSTYVKYMTSTEPETEGEPRSLVTEKAIEKFVD